MGVSQVMEFEEQFHNLYKDTVIEIVTNNISPISVLVEKLLTRKNK